MILTAALISLGNMARGNATISHTAWVAYCVWIAVCFAAHPVAWLIIVITCTIRATGPTLLIGIDGSPKAIWKGLVRNLPILPACIWYPYAPIMFLHGFCYYLCGKLKYLPDKKTRIAEGISGAILGGVL